MIIALAKSPENARNLIETARSSVDANPTKNHADRIAGLTMVVDGLFSMGLDQDGIEIYDQINEIVFMCLTV
jgi:hypothetical protein